MSRSIAALFLLALIAGCGQSGPLYLPGNPSQVTTISGETGQTADGSGAAAEEQTEEDENGESKSDDR